MNYPYNKNNSKLHVGVLYIGRRGGICHYAYELVRVISQITQVTCYLSANNILLDVWSDLPCNVRVFDTYSGFTSLLWSMLSQQGALNVAHAINADAPDIVLDMGSGPWKGIIERHIRCNALLADVIHDVQFHPDRWRSLLQLYRLIYPRKADIFISASEYSHKQLLIFFPEKMHICSHHGVIHSPEEVNSDAIANNRNQLLFFGRIEKYKGIEVLVDAFEIAKKTDPTLSLTIAGLGPLSSNLKDKIFSLNIRLINRWIDDKELDALLASHGVVVMPYLSATQSGVAAIAIANGLPAISTNVGALPEQIIDGKNGLIVPPNDPAALASAMVAVAQDYELSYRMSQEACQLATTIYSWNNIGHELLENLKKYSA